MGDVKVLKDGALSAVQHFANIACHTIYDRSQPKADMALQHIGQEAVIRFGRPRSSSKLKSGHPVASCQHNFPTRNANV